MQNSFLLLAPIQVHITGQGDIYRIADLSRPLELRCYVTTGDETVTGQWIQPNNSQHAEIGITRLSNGTELLLRISRPALTDVGRYYCRAGQAEAYIDVAIEETARKYLMRIVVMCLENRLYGRY